MSDVWKGFQQAEDVTPARLYQNYLLYRDYMRKEGITLGEGERIFECHCVDCGAKQLFKVDRRGVPSLIRSEHVC
jgi:hypothetical protein